MVHELARIFRMGVHGVLAGHLHVAAKGQGANAVIRFSTGKAKQPLAKAHGKHFHAHAAQLGHGVMSEFVHNDQHAQQECHGGYCNQKIHRGKTALIRVITVPDSSPGETQNQPALTLVLGVPVWCPVLLFRRITRRAVSRAARSHNKTFLIDSGCWSDVSLSTSSTVAAMSEKPISPAKKAATATSSAAFSATDFAPPASAAS